MAAEVPPFDATSTTIVGKANMAREFGISTHRLDELVQAGMPTFPRKGGSEKVRFPVVAAAMWRGIDVATIDERRTARLRKTKERGADGENPDDYEYWDLQYKKEQAEKLRLANEKTRSEIVSRADSIAQLTGVLMRVRAAMEKVPERVAVLAVGKRKDDIRDIVIARINEGMQSAVTMLEELARQAEEAVVTPDGD